MGCLLNTETKSAAAYGLRIASLAACFLMLSGGGVAFAASGGPLDAYTGAPAEAGGMEPDCTSCHSSFAVDSGPGLLSISAPQSYEPGSSYEIRVQLTHAGRMRWGFELTALDESLVGAGEFLAGSDGSSQVSLTGTREYVKQTSAGSADGQLDQQEWVFSWIAPQTDIGPVTLWAAGVAGNSTGGSSGDDVYTAAIEVPEPSIASLQFAGCLALAGITFVRRSGVRGTRRDD
jgi:hypothetical protein